MRYGEQRLHSQIAELQKQWDLLAEKLSRMEEEKILETRTEEKFRLERTIDKIKVERQQIEQQLKTLETQLPPETENGSRTYSDQTEERSVQSDIKHKVQQGKAFVSGYEYDIFVSFAEVDDQPHYGAKEGWVTMLIKELRNLLAQRLGSTNAFSLWSVHQLPGNVSKTSEITKILSNTAAFIVVLSPGYLVSHWCQQEKDSFLNMVKGRVRAGSRVFVIERDQLEPEEYPSEFADLKGYQFWVIDRDGMPPRVLGDPVPARDEELYYGQLNSLCYDLVKELRRLKASAASIN